MENERQEIYTMTNKNRSIKLGRPRQFEEEDVLDRAATAFLKDGFEAASYERIARDVGLSKPSLYNSFGDKTALFERVLSGYAAQAHYHLIASFSNAGSLKKAVEEIFNAAAQFYSSAEGPSTGCLLVGTALPSTSHNGATQKILSDFTHQLETSLKQTIAAQYDCDLMKSGRSSEQIANHVCSLIFALAVRARMGLTEEQMLSCAKDCGELVV